MSVFLFYRGIKYKYRNTPLFCLWDFPLPVAAL